MSGFGALDCSCLSGAHGHEPGGCPHTVAENEEELCESCREQADIDTHVLPEGAVTGSPVGGVRSVALEGRASIKVSGAAALGVAGSLGGDVASALDGASATGAASDFASAMSTGTDATEGRAPEETMASGRSYTLVAEPGHYALTGSPVEFEVREAASAQDTYDAEVIPGVWGAAGIASSEPLARIERELLLFKSLAEALENAKRNIGSMRGHNGGPALVDWPDIDIAGIEDTLAAVRELRVQIANRHPDPKLLSFIQRFLEAGKRALYAFAVWMGKKGDKFFDGLMASLCTPSGATGWAAIAYELANGRLAHDLHEAAQVIVRLSSHL